MNKILRIWLVFLLLAGIHFILIGLVYGPDPLPVSQILVSSGAFLESIQHIWYPQSQYGNLWLNLENGFSRYFDLVLYPFVYWKFLYTKATGKSVLDEKLYFVLCVTGLVFHDSFWLSFIYYATIGYLLTPYQDTKKAVIFCENISLLILVIAWTFPSLQIGISIAPIFFAAANLGIVIGNRSLLRIGKK